MSNVNEPPYDGIPCPMCPLDIRNLSAVAHNLAWRLIEYRSFPYSPCKIVSKAHHLRRAVEMVTLNYDAPKELLQLHQTCKDACKADTLPELLEHADKLKAASDAVRPLSDAHFANRRHSHP